MSSYILSELVELNAGVLQDTWLGPCTSIHLKPRCIAHQTFNDGTILADILPNRTEPNVSLPGVK